MLSPPRSRDPWSAPPRRPLRSPVRRALPPTISQAPPSHACLTTNPPLVPGRSRCPSRREGRPRQLRRPAELRNKRLLTFIRLVVISRRTPPAPASLSPALTRPRRKIFPTLVSPPVSQSGPLPPLLPPMWFWPLVRLLQAPVWSVPILAFIRLPSRRPSLRIRYYPSLRTLPLLFNPHVALLVFIMMCRIPMVFGPTVLLLLAHLL